MSVPIQYSGPAIDPSVPWEIGQHIQLLYQKLGNHTQAMALLAAKSSTTTNVTETVTGSIGGGGTASASGITVNNQSGATSYTTVAGDNLALLIFSDASPVAVTLSPQDPPYGFFATNLGAGTVTFTPASGTVNGSSSFALYANYTTILVFDGTNWWAAEFPVVPVNTPAIASEWLNSYNSATGEFGQSQPAYSDLTGTPTLPATITPVTGEYLTGYNASTGNFSQSTPAGLSVTITTAALTSVGTQGSMTFVGGILTAQVPAT